MEPFWGSRCTHFRTHFSGWIGGCSPGDPFGFWKKPPARSPAAAWTAAASTGSWRRRGRRGAGQRRRRRWRRCAAPRSRTWSPSPGQPPGAQTPQTRERLVCWWRWRGTKGHATQKSMWLVDGDLKGKVSAQMRGITWKRLFLEHIWFSQLQNLCKRFVFFGWPLRIWVAQTPAPRSGRGRGCCCEASGPRRCGRTSSSATPSSSPPAAPGGRPCGSCGAFRRREQRVGNEWETSRVREGSVNGKVFEV